MWSLSIPVVFCLSAFTNFIFTQYNFSFFGNTLYTEDVQAIMPISKEILWFSSHNATGNVIRYSFCTSHRTGTKRILPAAKHLSVIKLSLKNAYFRPWFSNCFFFSSNFHSTFLKIKFYVLVLIFSPPIFVPYFSVWINSFQKWFANLFIIHLW